MWLVVQLGMQQGQIWALKHAHRHLSTHTDNGRHLMQTWRHFTHMHWASSAHRLGVERHNTEAEAQQQFCPPTERTTWTPLPAHLGMQPSLQTSKLTLNCLSSPTTSIAHHLQPPASRHPIATYNLFSLPTLNSILSNHF